MVRIRDVDNRDVDHRSAASDQSPDSAAAKKKSISLTARVDSTISSTNSSPASSSAGGNNSSSPNLASGNSPKSDHGDDDSPVSAIGSSATIAASRSANGTKGLSKKGKGKLAAKKGLLNRQSRDSASAKDSGEESSGGTRKKGKKGTGKKGRRRKGSAGTDDASGSEEEVNITVFYAVFTILEYCSKTVWTSSI